MMFRGVRGKNFRQAEPPNPFDILGPSNVTLFLYARNALTSAGNVLSVADPSSGPDQNPSGSVTYLASDVPFGGADTPSIVFGNTSSFLSCQNDRPGPATEPTYSAGLWYDQSWVNNQKVLSRIDGVTNNMAYLMSPSSPGYVGANSSGGNVSFGAIVGQWNVHERNYAGKNTLTAFDQDYIVTRSLIQAGVNMGGVQDRFGFSIGRGAGRKVKAYFEAKITPSYSQRIDLMRWFEFLGGANSLRTPVPPNVVPFIIEGQSNSISQGTNSNPTLSYGAGTESIPFSVMVKTSEFADAAGYPTLLRLPFSWHTVAGLGKWGPEVPMAALLAAASRPSAFAKCAVGATNAPYAISGAGKALRDTLLNEYAQDQYWNSATKATILIDRFTTDTVEGCTRTEARDRLVALVNDIKSKLPASCLADCCVIVMQVNPLMVPGASNIATVNLGLQDGVALIPNATFIKVDGTDSQPVIPLSTDNVHYNNTGTSAWATKAVQYALAH